MADLFWTAPALADLKAIDSYLSVNADGATAARQLDAILKRAERLTDFPHAGAALGNRGFRTLRVLGTPYTLLYRVTRPRVELLRIAHERQNFGNMLA